MYNPDTLIISKEEKMELPQSPVFYEDDYPYPWKPFKSNRGTGDAPPDWFKPSTTAIPQPEPVTPKLCPFRKKTVFYQNDYTTHAEGEKVMLNLPRAEWMEEEFLPCIREKCAVWNEKGQMCCYDLYQIPAADVVQCGECKLYDSRPWENDKTGICVRTDIGVRYDDFCSYGVRKDDESNA